MTTRDRPQPPDDIDREFDELLDGLERRDADTLRAVGSYLEDLAAWKAADADNERQSATDTDSEDGDDTPDATETDVDDLEYPSGVPERASVTVKEIAGTTYHYYQWRDGDRIESKTVER
ncbi:hypothetical protein [Natronorubrum tibetense]|uniref:Uncharacterized protein n=1 Tax=Natronorubrum tibetense GA33 TaxID=1114856 RepID=L9VSI3_9EURY|nr:hypothetical protein [Natronorubrum tibetense]ELY39228.1 hypothetical protein C496_15262 [Natronorubrum tibetense GA33]